MTVHQSGPVYDAVERDPLQRHARELHEDDDLLEKQIAESTTLSEAISTAIYGRLQTTFLERSEGWRDPQADYPRWQDTTFNLLDEDVLAARTEAELLTVLGRALQRNPAGRAALLLPIKTNLATSAKTVESDFLAIQVDSDRGKQRRDEIVNLSSVLESFDIILTAQNDPIIQLYKYIEQRFRAYFNDRQLEMLKKDLILGGKQIALRNIYMRAIRLTREWQPKTSDS